MQEAPAKKSLLHQIARGVLFAGFGLSFFIVGWAIGSGRLSLLDKGLQTQNAALPENLDYSSVEQVYDELRANYDGKLDVNTLLDGLKNGLAQATGDPYTEYMNKKDAQEFDEELNGSFDGIGAELSKEKDQIVIVSPIHGYPAQKEGLRPRDAIIEIDGTPTYNMSLTDAVKKIRGPAGTDVKLTIGRDGQELTFTVTRESITVPSVEHEVIDGVGYIQISRFAEDTASLSKKAAEDLKSKNVKGIVLDVRGNPGGLLDAAVDVASLWLEGNQMVLQEKRGGEVIKTYMAHGNPTLKGIPTVLLIDEGSASASEIVAGALADNKAATLIGVKTFGKGSVQDLEQISSGGVLKVTIARWYTPNGQNIDKQGINPTKKVKLDEKAAKAGKDNQKSIALKFLQKQ